ncbi:hypothetical protein CDG60_12645 [Acinetobacter chinensis]|uniref:Uncharacterized protein n=1 Tax=Acinetobacter chinensis TaxID=2004650 RepID=A0A3B7LY55_9GAMM|nr:hypothetical protein [Acinetobacter chinensis]AXY57338.1 hypothetical protein CDG60_12645 [Acinetobacter chinensis]
MTQDLQQSFKVLPSKKKKILPFRYRMEGFCAGILLSLIFYIFGLNSAHTKAALQDKPYQEAVISENKQENLKIPSVSHPETIPSEDDNFTQLSESQLNGLFKHERMPPVDKTRQVVHPQKKTAEQETVLREHSENKKSRNLKTSPSPSEQKKEPETPAKKFPSDIEKEPFHQLILPDNQVSDS